VPNQLREFAASSNGDRWFLGQEEETGLAYVVHKANEPSGGALTSIDLGAFLYHGPIAPEHHALLRLIGSLAHEENSPVGPKTGSAAPT
jgi:hypothetical protein